MANGAQLYVVVHGSIKQGEFVGIGGKVEITEKERQELDPEGTCLKLESEWEADNKAADAAKAAKAKSLKDSADAKAKKDSADAKDPKKDGK